MAKRLVVLVGVLAMMLVTAVPAFAQERQEEITVAGVLQQEGHGYYLLTETATGQDYLLKDRGAGLGDYVGDPVSVSGTPAADDPSVLPVLDVTRVAPIDVPPPKRSARFDFQLTVKGEPPADARFFGAVPAEGCISVPLADPDGDGVFTGSLNVPRFPPGPLPPEGAEPVSLPVQIVQANSGAGPCNPTAVIEDFGTVPANDDTFKARVNFKKDRDGGTTTPGSDDGGSPDGSGSGSGGPGSGGSSGGSGDSGSGSSSGGSDSGSGGSSSGGSSSGGSGDRPSSSSGGEMKVLPRTGGALPAVGVVGALLVAGGLLVRCATR